MIRFSTEAEAAGLTIAAHTMLDAVTVIIQRRRHLWLDLQAEGATYDQLAHRSAVSRETVKTQLALAREERSNGSWPAS